MSSERFWKTMIWSDKVRGGEVMDVEFGLRNNVSMLLPWNQSIALV